MREITVIEASNEIQVRYLDSNHYEVYQPTMKDRFIAEVEESHKYINLIDWQTPISPINDSATSAGA